MTTTILVMSLLAAGRQPSEEIGRVRSEDYKQCGVTSLYLACRLIELDVDYTHVRSTVGTPNADGTHTLDDLQRAAVLLGVKAAAIRVTDCDPRQLPTPAIAHVSGHTPNQQDHFVAVVAVEDDDVIVVDAPFPARRVPSHIFAKTWSGYALVVRESESELTSALYPARGRSLAMLIAVVVACTTAVVTLVAFRRVLRAMVTRPLGLLIVVTVGVGLTIAGWSCRPTAVASCVVETPLISLGEVGKAPKTATIYVHNNGLRTLTISAVRSSCACISATYDGTPIPPGERAAILVTLRDSRGPQAARVIIESNDPSGPKSARLVWHKPLTSHFEPVGISAPQTPTGRALVREVKLVYPGGDSVPTPQLTNFTSPSGRVTAELIANDPSAEVYSVSSGISPVGIARFRLTVAPQSEPGLFAERCQVEFRSGEQKTSIDFHVVVHFWGGDVTGDVPAVVFAAGDSRALADVMRDVALRGALPADVPIESPSWLVGTVVRYDNGTATLKLRIVGPPPSGTNTTSVRLLSGPEGPTLLTLPIHTLIP